MTGKQTAQRVGTSRRAVLATLGSAGALSLAGCIGDDDEEDQVAEDDALKIGVSIPESNGRTTEGEQLLDGYELAVDNINDGTGAITVDPWTDIDGGGILDREIELVVEDTAGTESGAQASGEALLDDGVEMITGGASIEEGHGLQATAAAENVIYMGGFTPSDELGGSACTRYGFHEMYNPTIAAKSLAQVLANEIDDDALDFFQVYTNDEFGSQFSSAMRDQLEDVRRWNQIRRESATTGARSYTGDIEGALGTSPDLVVLNFYGLDGRTAIRDFASVVEEQLDPDDEVFVVMPFFGPTIADGAGDAFEDVLGTVHWFSGLGGDFSEAFESAWNGDRSTPYPSQFAHLAYVQLCQYAAAVERAGTFDTDAVIDELEGVEYDVGAGRQELRGCDHQAMRWAPVVRGRSQANQSPGAWYELTAAVADGSDNPPYGCNSTPAWACDME